MCKRYLLELYFRKSFLRFSFSKHENKFCKHFAQNAKQNLCCANPSCMLCPSLVCGMTLRGEWGWWSCPCPFWLIWDCGYRCNMCCCWGHSLYTHCCEGLSCSGRYLLYMVVSDLFIAAVAAGRVAVVDLLTKRMHPFRGSRNMDYGDFAANLKTVLGIFEEFLRPPPPSTLHPPL